MKAQSSYRFISFLLKEFKANRTLIIVAGSFIMLSFSIYFVLDYETICSLGRENSLFESLTPVFFFSASVIFFRIFLRKKTIFFLLFSLVLFMGAGEEISWGQKLFHFNTPQRIKDINVQQEFNVHNIELLNSHYFGGAPKTGWRKLASVNNLFKGFWFFYGVMVPLGFFGVRPLRRILEKVKLPIPPLSLGILFFLNYVIMKILGSVLPSYESFQYLDTAGEIYECGTALIFLTISLSFLRTMKKERNEPAS